MGINQVYLEAVMNTG